MAPKPFQFKRFSVADDRCAHKVGTDGVLLGTWANILKTDKRFLDIGTGSGLIALILAQRSAPASQIDAIEIEAEDAQQARTNIAASPWPQKVNVIHTSLQNHFAAGNYDLIVSNPPYFVRSLLPPARKRTQARHTESLPFEDLLEGVNRLLAPSGRFAVILPFAESRDFLMRAEVVALHPRRVTRFATRRNKPVERMLIEFSKEKLPAEEQDLVLYSEGESWSEAYRSLTADLYLTARDRKFGL